MDARHDVSGLIKLSSFYYSLKSQTGQGSKYFLFVVGRDLQPGKDYHQLPQLYQIFPAKFHLNQIYKPGLLAYFINLSDYRTSYQQTRHWWGLYFIKSIVIKLSSATLSVCRSVCLSVFPGNIHLKDTLIIILHPLQKLVEKIHV